MPPAGQPVFAGVRPADHSTKGQQSARGPRLRTGRSALFGGWEAHRATGGRYSGLRGRPGTVDAERERRACLNERLRQAFLEGAEVDSRRRLGRGLTADELERILRRYPGDLPESREQ